jgi:hypothetical protein
VTFSSQVQREAASSFMRVDGRGRWLVHGGSSAGAFGRPWRPPETASFKMLSSQAENGGLFLCGVPVQEISVQEISAGLSEIEEVPIV